MNAHTRILKIVFLFVFLGIVINTVYSAAITSFPYYINVSGTYWINGTLKCNASPCIIINTTGLVTLQGNSTAALDSYGNLTIYINSTINTVNLIINHVYIYNTTNIAYITSAAPILLNITLENNTIVSSSEYFMNYTANPQNYIFKIINSNFETEQYLNNTVSGTLEIINSTTTKDIYCYSFNYNEFHSLLIYNSTVYNISLYGGYGIVNVNLSNISKLYIQSYSKNTSYEEKIENSVFNVFVNLNFIRNITINNCTFNYIRTGWTGTVTPTGQLYYYHNHLFLNNSKIYHEFGFVPGDTAVSFYVNDFMFCDSNLLFASPYPLGDPCEIGSWHALVENSTIIYNRSGNFGHNITVKYSTFIINGSIIYQHGVPNQTGLHLINSLFLVTHSTLYWGNIITKNDNFYVFDSTFSQEEVFPSFLASLRINLTSYFNSSFFVFNNSVNIFNLTNTTDIINNSTIYVENFAGTTTAYRNVFNFITPGTYVGHGFINNTKIIINNTNIYTNLFHFNYAYVFLNNVTFENNSTNVYLNSIVRLDYGSFANITNTSFCVPFYIKYNLLFEKNNSSSFIGRIWINPSKISNISYIINWPDDSFYCNKTPLFKVYNQLRIFGRFELSGPNGIKTPYIFSIKNIPFKFIPNNFTINITKAIEHQGEYNIFQENSSKNYGIEKIVKYTSSFDIINEKNNYKNGFYFSDSDVLKEGLIGPYSFTKFIVFNPIYVDVPLNNIINISLNVNSNESLLLCENRWIFGKTCNAYYSTTYVYILLYVFNSNTSSINNYIILIGKNNPSVINYLSTLGNVTKIITPTTSTITLNLNEIIGDYNPYDVLVLADIGIVKYLSIPTIGTIVLNNKKFSIKNLVHTNQVNDQIFTFYFNSSTDINNFKIIATANKTLTYLSPFPYKLFKINGQTYPTFPIVINTSTIAINSNIPLTIYGNIELYGNITIPFKQLNTFTYSALYNYLFDHMFIINSVFLYGLPYFAFRITHNITRYYYNNSTNVSKIEDLTKEFKMIFGKEGLCYKLSNPNDFSLVSNILEKYYNFVLYFNTTWYKKEPDIFPARIFIKTENNSVTDLITKIRAINISNYTITTNVTNILQCGNKTIYYNTTINISNKTTIYDFNVVPYVYNLYNTVCNYTIILNPQFDIIRSDNKLSTSFFILPQKTGVGNLTVVVYNASSNTIIPADIYLYYANGTLVASNTSNNGVVEFTNLNFSYYYIVVENTSYETLNRSFYLGNSTYYIYAYLVPKSISKTKYSVLQICIQTKDDEPVQEHNVSIYFLNGTLYKTIKVNSTGCGSTIVPANLTYKLATFVNLTWYNQTVFAYPITVKPYTESIIKTNIISNNVEPEAMIIYAKTFSIMQQTGEIPVFYAIYSSVPQNVTVNITLQKLFGTNWTYVNSIQYNMTFRQYKQVKTNSTAFQINTNTVSTYRYVVIIYPQNDTNTSNNIKYTQNFTIFPEIDYSLTLFNSKQNVKPGEKINITMMLNGTINSQCNISITEKYEDPYTLKEITKTTYLNLTTNNSTNLTFTVPYTNYLIISANIHKCYLFKMDMNNNNNNDTANQTEISDARIIIVKYPKVTHTKNITLNVTIISNYPLNIWINITNGSSFQVVPIKFGNNSYLVNITIPNLKSYSYNHLNVQISGDEDPYKNTYPISILYISPKYTGIIFIVLIIIGVLIAMGITKKLVLKSHKGSIKIKYYYRKR